MDKLTGFRKIEEPLFTWEVILCEAYYASQDMTLQIHLTEKDLTNMVAMFRETAQDQHKGELHIDPDSLLNAQMSHKDLMHLVIDMLCFDPTENLIYVSY